MSRRCSLLAFVAAALASPFSAQGDVIEIKPGDHISIIGNTLADRMQHDGWLETGLQARFPEHKLVIRNLGFSGDELTLRLRSAGFGTPDQWLTRTKADVVFAFFGYNESFAGKDGLAAFKNDLNTFIKHTFPSIQRQVGPSAGVVLADCHGAITRPRPARAQRPPTSDSSSTPPRWARWPGPTASRSSTCTTLLPPCTRKPPNRSRSTACT